MLFPLPHPGYSTWLRWPTPILPTVAKGRQSGRRLLATRVRRYGSPGAVPVQQISHTCAHVHMYRAEITCAELLPTFVKTWVIPSRRLLCIVAVLNQVKVLLVDQRAEALVGLSKALVVHGEKCIICFGESTHSQRRGRQQKVSAMKNSESLGAAVIG